MDRDAWKKTAPSRIPGTVKDYGKDEGGGGGDASGARNGNNRGGAGDDCGREAI